MVWPSLAVDEVLSPVLTSPLITSPANVLSASRMNTISSDGLDGNVGLDRTPPGVRSPVAHPTVDDSSLVDGVMRKPTAMTLHKTTSKSERVDFCHTFSSNRGVSSQRTRAAAGAHVLKSSAKLLSRNAVKRLNRRSRRKQIKQDNNLVNVYSPGRKVDGLYTIPFLKDNVLVFDGGKVLLLLPFLTPKFQVGAVIGLYMEHWMCVCLLHQTKD